MGRGAKFGHIVSEETRNKISNTIKLKGATTWNKNKHWSNEMKLKISEGRKGKGHPVSKETKEKLRIANTGKTMSKESCDKISYYQRNNTGRMLGNKFALGSRHTPEWKEERRQAMLLLWQTQEYVSKILKRHCPTKPELYLEAILLEYFPEFKYNGCYNLGIVLNRMCPDFVNVNGKKMVIEVFGDYWHSGNRLNSWKSSEIGRVMSYNSIGWECLVIWQKELKNNSKTDIVAKIEKFTRGTSSG